MKAVILGGTRFLGRHIAERLVAGGHDVTVFHRGNSMPHGLPRAHNVAGDRDVSLDALDEEYDCVIDTSGYLPRQMRRSVEHFRERAPRYLFVSSVSAYADPLPENADESAPLLPAGNSQATEMTVETYGSLKVACEEVVAEAYGGDAIIVRPGLIVGPFDPTDRFTYWIRRFSQGGDILAPGAPERLVGFIDARDLAAWIVTISQNGTTGTFNATGPGGALTFGEFFAACGRIAPAHTVRWFPEKPLLDAGVAPWSELPLWIPKEEAGGFDTISSARAVAAGLQYRSVDETVVATLEWDRLRGSPPLVAGLSAERERELLEMKPGV